MGCHDGGRDSWLGRDGSHRDGVGAIRSSPWDVQITRVQPEDAPQLGVVHIAARRDAMPYLPELHAAEAVAAWFDGRVQDMPDAFRVARSDGQVVGYMVLCGDGLDDLYVMPGWQGHGVGSALLAIAQSLSPHRIVLSVFQQNAGARRFYEARGFREIGRTDGQNEEGLPDVQYEWCGG